MAIAREHHRAPGSMLPWLPLPAIVAFGLLGLGGSIVLTYTTFSYAEAKKPVTPSNDPRVFEARAVPFDLLRENPAQRADISRALRAAQVEIRHAEVVDSARRPEISQPLLVADSNRELQGFRGFGNFSGGNSYFAVTGTTAVGISAQSAPSGGFVPADAETISVAPVPEASTWMCGAALLILVGARGMRARLHRNRRR